MKAIILAAGYATRLYPLTLNQAKPLLKVQGKPIIDYMLNQLKLIPEIDQILVITNNQFYPDFLRWSTSYNDQKLLIINDQTKSNSERLGAIGDLALVIKQQRLEDDLLVIAGDNLFEFNLRDLLIFFNQKNTSVVALHDVQDKEKIRGKLGAALVQEERVVAFAEKPEQPASTLAATACYIFHNRDLQHILELVQTGITDPVGLILNRLIKLSAVSGFIFHKPWFDVGSPDSLEEANSYYGQKKN